MSNETVARRYAAALADVVLKSGETENVRGELQTWEQLVMANTDLQSAFRNPVIQQHSKEKVLESLLEKARPSKTTANFLRLLLRNGRLTDLGAINDRFASVLEERSGTVSAHITSARELSDGERQELKANLEKLTSRTVNLDFNVNEELIGGVVTRIGSTVYDGSVRTQLEELKQQLVNGE